MNSQVVQNACDSIIAIANPDIKMIWFAIAMINLVLMVKTRDIDYQDDYRQALIYIKETLEAYRETLDKDESND